MKYRLYVDVTLMFLLLTFCTNGQTSRLGYEYWIWCLCLLVYLLKNISIMVSKQSLVLLMSAWLVSGQRPSFAGFRPIGFPEVSTTEDPLGNKFGDSTERLPVEAKGDRNLIDRLSKLPIDQQPFWYINWKAIEENNKKPQTYPQRPNSFIDPNGSGGSNPGETPNSGIPNNQQNPADLTSKFGAVNSNGNSFNSSPPKRQSSQFHKYSK